MMALVFIVLSFAVGRRIFDATLRGAIERARAGREAVLPLWLLVWPASYVVGTLVLTWATYLAGYVYRDGPHPLATGNAIAMGLACAVVVPGWIRKLSSLWRERAGLPAKAGLGLKQDWAEWTAFAVVVTGGYWMMHSTLAIRDGHTLNVGLSVFSDFGPHLSMIRSFSFGSNFPTQYPHFPDGSIRYHFLFQFLAGNMEFLGLPLDWAFNLPSLLALLSCAALLHGFAVVVTGKRAVGLLTLVFFYFRSSLAWFDFVKGIRPLSAIPGKVLANELFLGKTEHEDWGLWNQNVYLNQRHLPFGIAVLLLALIAMYPRLRQVIVGGGDAKPEIQRFTWWREFLFSKEAWLPEKGSGLRSAFGVGLILGLCAFWNGAAVIAALVILFFMAFVSARRLEFLILALTMGALGFAENRLFLGPGTLALQPQWNFGFLSQVPHTWGGVMRYYFELLGVFPFVLILGFINVRVSVNTLRFDWSGRRRPAGAFLLLLLFLTPIVLATTVQLTPEVSINHKYIMIGVMLLNILVASHLLNLWEFGRWAGKAVVVVLVFTLTGTGVIDLITLVNKNREKNALVANLEDPLLLWSRVNTPTSAVFLTDWYSIHPVLLSGRKIYYGWPYYAWSAGYDTLGREAIVKKIYGGTNADETRRLALANHIDYIVIDNENRKQSLYKLQEPLLTRLFKQVYAVNDLIVLKVD